MHHATRITLDVPADRAWSVLADVHHWPSWTPTVESITGDQLATGAVLRIKQPGRGVATYTVDLLETGRRFRWGSNRLGVRQSADHIITPAGDAACTVELSFTMDGPLGSPLGRLGAAKIRSMVDTEAASLRAAVSAGAGNSA
ncbi:hypothetical protein GCM10023321_48120 [Pseudonocardia eucalypti]|uniref:Polyketide cyclase/dehydrase/lipid transport protein n=1 Tax=Pseudonocardia eucalypti TaxID=648755 RepID=A0ABP9QID6_9PSEU|nr:hypothetical protein [Pseudonocardia eucalypti]